MSAVVSKLRMCDVVCVNLVVYKLSIFSMTDEVSGRVRLSRPFVKIL